jgi:glyoxylase-like metal-dependent hydrolase (beta-lactamase superfamily II)
LPDAKAATADRNASGLPLFVRSCLQYLAAFLESDGEGSPAAAPAGRARAAARAAPVVILISGFMPGITPRTGSGWPVAGRAPGSLPAMERLAEGVYRLGSSWISWFLVEGAASFTVVDAGLPGYRSQLDEALTELGADVGDVKAVILTHGHPDHVGFAGKLQEEAAVPVLVHEGDEKMTRTGKVPGGERGLRPYLLKPRLYRLAAHGALNGGARPPKVAKVTTFGDGERLDVPGRPRVTHAPGHTRGCCAFLFEDRGVLLAGDVLCTTNPMTGREGPQIMPASFTVSPQQALESLDAIVGIDAEIVGVGHGEPWTRGPREAVAAARVAGPS